jgi:hypothetical protein
VFNCLMATFYKDGVSEAILPGGTGARPTSWAGFPTGPEAIPPAAQGVRASSNEPSGWPKDIGEGVSHRVLTLLPATPASYAEPLRIGTRH